LVEAEGDSDCLVDPNNTSQLGLRKVHQKGSFSVQFKAGDRAFADDQMIFLIVSLGII
jgi:hypothetical protein